MGCCPYIYIEIKKVNIQMSIIKKLEQILENAEYASSEVCSARESLPDYSANESSNTMMSQAESYLCDATDDLQTLIDNLKYDQRLVEN